MNTSCSEHKKNSAGPEQSQAILWNIPDIEADELAFGLVEENRSKILSLEIKNSSGSTLSGTPSVTGDESFKLIYTNCLNLAPNKKCSVKIGFKPLDNSLENRSGNLVYGAYTNLIFGAVHKLENETIQFFNGATPLSTLNLGQLNYNQSLIKTIKIVNSGDITTNYPLELSGDKFNLVYDQCSNKPLSPKKSCVFKLYTTGIGQSGVIEDSVTYGDSELSLQIQVNNFETVRLFSNIQLFYNNSVLDSILDLGTVNWKEFKLLNLNYKNSGEQAGEIGPISYNYNLYYDNCQNKILNPNGSCLIKLDLDTTSPGIFSKELSSLINGSVVSHIFQYQVRTAGEKLNCSSQIPFAAVANLTWSGTQWSGCVVEQCEADYYISDNACILNNSVVCDNQEDSFGNIIGYGFLNFTENEGITCKIKECVTEAYALNGGYCECTNPEGCFVSPEEINATLLSVNEKLTLSDQENLTLINESAPIDFISLNNTINELKKYDPNNTIQTLSGPLTKGLWATQATEMNRLSNLYYTTCLNYPVFNQESVEEGQVCSLSNRVLLNLQYFNNFFPFYGDTAVSLPSWTSNTFLGFNEINSVVANFNNKTNKPNSVPTLGAGDTINTNINPIFSNLRLNIKQKLETTIPNYLSNPYSTGVNISNMSTNFTNKGYTVSFKIEDLSSSDTLVGTLFNSTVCVNNEYCKTPTFGTHFTGTQNLVEVSRTLSGSLVSSVIQLKVVSTAVNAQGSTSDFGCYDAPAGSSASRNTWACDGGGTTCTRFCYLNGEGGGCINSSTPQTLFNNYFNASGKYQYVTWAKTTGDLRAGCSGNYVYGFRVTYNRQTYTLGL